MEVFLFWSDIRGKLSFCYFFEVEDGSCKPACEDDAENRKKNAWPVIERMSNPSLLEPVVSERNDSSLRMIG